MHPCSIHRISCPPCWWLNQEPILPEPLRRNILPSPFSSHTTPLEKQTFARTLEEHDGFPRVLFGLQITGMPRLFHGCFFSLVAGSVSHHVCLPHQTPDRVSFHNFDSLPSPICCTHASAYLLWCRLMPPLPPSRPSVRVGPGANPWSAAAFPSVVSLGNAGRLLSLAQATGHISEAVRA